MLLSIKQSFNRSIEKKLDIKEKPIFNFFYWLFKFAEPYGREVIRLIFYF